MDNGVPWCSATKKPWNPARSAALASWVALDAPADLTQMEQLYAQRRLAYAEAHVRIDATRPVAEVAEQILDWIGY